MNQTLAAPGFGPSGFHPQAFGPFWGLRAPLAPGAYFAKNQEYRW
ncbi:Unknown protein sequence [Pseudomonas syringae pv. maculicola]|nr:Unknown protein sequence [Pseudomonas syringae pv. maculicola]